MQLRNLPWKEQALAKAVANELAAVLPAAIEAGVTAALAARDDRPRLTAADRLTGR